jgi:hypothetical protein
MCHFLSLSASAWLILRITVYPGIVYVQVLYGDGNETSRECTLKIFIELIIVVCGEVLRQI